MFFLETRTIGEVPKSKEPELNYLGLKAISPKI